MALFQRISALLIAFLVLSGVKFAYADKVYLKDGTVELSDRVWQSERYIHFILNGTQGVVIRYSKDIVDRVLIDGKEVSVTAGPPKETPADSVQQNSKATLTATVPSNLKAPTESITLHRSKSIDQKLIRAHKGVSFYDPRRNKRYWAFNDSRHRALSDALKALAHAYSQSIEWVETHMGAENDLGIIHQNLMMQRDGGVESPVEKVEPQPACSNLFYNKNEDKPYRVGPKQAYKSQAEAVKALARKYGRSEDWVQHNFGNSNELKTIHANLAKANQMPDRPAVPEKAVEASSSPIEDIVPKGLEFYNPRRTKKYWTSEKDRYNSMGEAMQALAKQYGVTVDWIDRNMGNTNDLALIHRNIQKSLQ